MNSISQNSIAESKQLSADTFQTSSVSTRVKFVDKKADDSKAVDRHNHVIAIVQKAEELWLNHEGQPGITISVNGHSEHYLLGQSQFKDWLHNEYYKQYGAILGSKELSDAMNIVKAMCRYNAKQYRTWWRIGEVDGKIYIDLANDSWQAVEIDTQDWRIVNPTHIKFLRTKDMLPQCPPIQGGNIDQLKSLLNIGDQQFVLLVGFIIKCFDPKPPYPLLTILGGQGSGKTEMSEMIVSLIAPLAVSIRSMPRSERDLLLAAKYNHIFAVDNLSGITNEQSDWLCRLSTGAGFSSRKLFSDNEESTIAVSRPLILNGIDEVIGRPDLLDRTVVIHVPQLPENNRKTTQSLREEFKAAKPEILGVLYDALVTALRNHKQVQLSRKPRMLDFANFVTAAEEKLGWEKETFLNAYMASIEEINGDSLALNPLAIAVVDYMKHQKIQERTASDWIQSLKYECRLESYASLIPRHPNKFSKEIMRIAPQLRKEGLLVERAKSNGTRLIRVSKASDSQ